MKYTDATVSNVERGEQMSVSMYQTKADRLRKSIAALRKQLAQEKDKEARKSKEFTITTRSLAKTKSTSTFKTKQNKANRLMGEIAKIQKGVAGLEGQIASKTKDLHNAEQRVSKEQAKLRAAELRHERALTQEVEKRRHLEDLRRRLSDDFPEYETSPHEEKYDVFISHASQDKEDFVEPLAELLRDMGFEVWYDDFVLTAGDSLRESIDKGIRNSEYGLIVLSPNFIFRNKGWAGRELNGLTAREVAGRRKLILPVWYNISYEEVLEFSPTLVDKYALNTEDMSLEEIADAIAEVLPGQPDPEEDQLDADEAMKILSDPTEERIPWEMLKNEMLS